MTGPACPFFPRYSAYMGMDAHTAEETFLEHLPGIERLIALTTRRFRLSTADSEDFASAVRLRLIDNNYEILRKFRGQSSLQTFLAVVVTRCCLDYCRARDGRWRPSVRARRLGPAAMALERLMVRFGLTFADARQSLATSNTYSPGQLESLGERAVSLRPRAVEGVDPDTLPAKPEPDLVVGVAERRRIAVAVREALATLDVSDRRLLYWRYRVGLTVTQIAHREGLERKRLYRRVERVLHQLRLELARLGITVNDARAVVGGTDGGR